jgi:hypothetical protein
MPSSVSEPPPDTASKPLIALKKPAPGPWVFGLTARSIEYLTSSAVISRPLWNFTPGRSLKVKVLPSGEIS